MYSESAWKQIPPWSELNLNAGKKVRKKVDIVLQNTHWEALSVRTGDNCVRVVSTIGCGQ